jgi:hypothetical protein
MKVEVPLYDYHIEESPSQIKIIIPKRLMPKDFITKMVLEGGGTFFIWLVAYAIIFGTAESAFKMHTEFAYKTLFIIMTVSSFNGMETCF